eukprot:TRINITY_DN5080_c0_g1_i1.p1 TRINITY_DN5080_c0_g1~~TRINITY_DN5080_c0_g1_i1.p1  ORF type:complete len:341 (-),score=17.81 TRINITY_DN5080_c0_g1_i1:38-1060(-)
MKAEDMDPYVRLIFLICAPLTLFGTILIMILFGTIPQLKRKGIHFVFFQALADFFFTLRLLLTCFHFTELEIVGNFTGCQIIGIIAQFSALCTIKWNMMISVKLFLTVVNKKFENISNLWFHAYVWTTATILTIIPIKHYGAVDNGCWITSMVVSYACFESVLILYFVLSILILSYVFYKISTHRSKYQTATGRRSKTTSTSGRFRTQMILYVAIFIVFWTAISALRILEPIQVEFHLLTWVSLKPFIYLNAVAVSTQGFANALVWICSKNFGTFLNEVHFPHCLWYRPKPGGQIEFSPVMQQYRTAGSGEDVSTSLSIDDGMFSDGYKRELKLNLNFQY